MRLNTSFFMTAIIALFCFSCKGRIEREVKHPLTGQLMEKFEVIETDNGSFLKDGYYKEWFSNGQVKASGQHKDNKRSGQWDFFYENGTKGMIMNYEDGKRTGEFLEWYKSGEKKSEGTYSNDQASGQWTEWYENQQAAAELNYNGGKLEGEQSFWYINGQLREKGSYSNGIKTGQWSAYDQDGVLSRKSNFVNGKDVILVGKWEVSDGYTIEYFEDETYVRYLTSNGSKRSKGQYELGNKELQFDRSSYSITSLIDDEYSIESRSFFGNSVTYTAKRVSTN